MNDMVKEEAELSFEKIGHFYPEEIRKQYVKLFLASQPITMTEFAAQHGLGRKSIRRWLDKYGGEYAHLKRRIPNAHETPKKPAARPAPLRSASNSYANTLTVTIPDREYIELLQIKSKYDAIRTIIR